MLDTETIKLAILVINFLIGIGAMIFTVIKTRRTDLDERLKAGSDKMDKLELRVQALEQVTAQLPDKDQHHELRLTLAEMAGDMKAMRATMRGMSESMARTESIVGRHEDHLRENH